MPTSVGFVEPSDVSPEKYSKVSSPEPVLPETTGLDAVAPNTQSDIDTVALMSAFAINQGIDCAAVVSSLQM